MFGCVDCVNKNQIPHIICHIYFGLAFGLTIPTGHENTEARWIQFLRGRSYVSIRNSRTTRVSKIPPEVLPYLASRISSLAHPPNFSHTFSFPASFSAFRSLLTLSLLTRSFSALAFLHFAPIWYSSRTRGENTIGIAVNMTYQRI